jgi:glycosyltransferase involved in cell wall biosynthesis
MVPRGDYEGLAREAIRLLQDATLAARIVSQARQECKKYSWEAVRNQWLSLYDQLVVEKVSQTPVSIL